ncbi:hypothetical protein [Halorubrum sp. 48-1-W]|uniref:hypothetical protein n=1 Tax=Halorubrum sp. 48-1-W TaxID=2249761 RepID=UPI000FC9DF34|nr:hypothetical protein [Halorubrum sp. 48-1-W]
MSIRPRELSGREVFESLQKFEWRYQTLKSDLNELKKVNSPEPGGTVSQHRFTVRSNLHDAERKLHHYLSGYYTFRCLITTLAQSSSNPEFTGRVKNRRDEFSTEESTRIILGLRHYVQHHNILPLLIGMSSLTEDGPWYVINKRELRLDDFEYREPQLVLDIDDYDRWFNYYFEGVDGVCIYPFYIIESNWKEIQLLREDIYELARDLLSEEIEEYIQQLKDLISVREELREKHDSVDELLSAVGKDITPELRELLEPEVYDRLVTEN